MNKISIEKIESRDIEVSINSKPHTVEEIKKEIRECFCQPETERYQVPIYEFWQDE